MQGQQNEVSIIQNTFSAGEIAPTLYGRTDLQKFHQACATMRNFFVDYKGGAASRPGTQFMGSKTNSGYLRLIPFIFSGAVGQSYMLVFGTNFIRFIKNPGTQPYPNSSNAGWILSSGSPYEVTTTYAAADLPYLKFQQIADVMYITRHGYPRKKLSRITDTNWTFTNVSSAITLQRPTISAITISALPAGSTDPQKTRYMFCVTAVDANGIESLPSPKFTSGAGIDIGATQGTVSVFWGAVSGAVYYKVYKALPAPGDVLPSPAEQVGFCGFSYGTVFTDSNVVPDFSKAPPTADDPFGNGKIIGYSITASSNDWSQATAALTVTDATGTGAELYPIVDSNGAGTTGHISGIWIANPGSGYSAPVVGATGGGTTFTAALSVGPTTDNDPDAVALFQQRIIYASSNNKPNSLFGSRPGQFDDFRKTNPTIDSDSYEFQIVSQQVNDVVWLQSMPGGLVIATNSGIVQLTGGSSSAANPVAVTPSSAVIVPQSYYGAADIHPIVIDYDILYVQAEAGVIRDLQYNFFVNIYTGTDVTILSSHMFYPASIVDWAYQDSPNKIIWAVRSDGILLSLTWLKAQEVMGWAIHQTNGTVESVAVVREGVTDAVYISVVRAGQRCVERLCDRIYYSIEDSWCLDAALSTPANYFNAIFTATGGTAAPDGGLYGTITLTASSGVFSSGMVGYGARATAKGSRGTVASFISSTQITVVIDPTFASWPLAVGQFGARIDPVVGALSGLDHLNGFAVGLFVDGLYQGTAVVASGHVNLITPGSSVVIGLPYICQLQPLYADAGNEVGTVQGKRKKVQAVSVRVKDTARLQIGTRFDTMQEFRPGISSTDPAQYWPELFPPAINLTFGDMRLIVDPNYTVSGSFCIEQAYPIPATILAAIPEYEMADQ